MHSHAKAPLHKSSVRGELVPRGLLRAGRPSVALAIEPRCAIQRLQQEPCDELRANGPMRRFPGRQRARRSAAVSATLILSCALTIAHVAAQNADGTPSDDAVAAAVEALEADPNLAKERPSRTLRWAREETPRPSGSFLEWIAEFFGWLAQLSRALVWVLGGMLALALIWLLFRLLKNAGPIRSFQPVTVPTHVHDLDIRPESLPNDIGAAALRLWQDGEHRAALALLYRGLLSRLVHVHAVPIRDSSTEGDCLDLASRHLPAERRHYIARLIGVWQRAVYGGHHPDAHEVRALCSTFDAALAPVSSSAAGSASS